MLIAHIRIWVVTDECCVFLWILLFIYLADAFMQTLFETNRIRQSLQHLELGVLNSTCWPWDLRWRPSDHKRSAPTYGGPPANFSRIRPSCICNFILPAISYKTTGTWLDGIAMSKTRSLAAATRPPSGWVSSDLWPPPLSSRGPLRSDIAELLTSVNKHDVSPFCQPLLNVSPQASVHWSPDPLNF